MRTRILQETSKRIDLASYQLGLHPTRNGIVLGDVGVRGEFFFAIQEVPARTILLKEYLSAEVQKIISEADEILLHRFRLLGYENVHYGPEIDWHLDAVHGKRAPLKPWFKIRFLDPSIVGDHKITWELNRHQHLVTLAKAWRLTGNENYADELVRQWYGWQAANPYPMGINWSSSLEVAFRTLSWLWIRYLLAGCPRVPPRFEEDLVHALAFNARYIERYLSTYFSPNTHLIGEATALSFVGMLCPQLTSSKHWRDHGWTILLKEAERQVHPDGVYFEQSLYYHVYALDFFLHARVLAVRNRIEVPAGFDVALQKMLSVLAALSRAGPPDGFGDDDGGRVFNPRRNQSEHLTDPLPIGALLFERGDFTHVSSLTEESVWLFGERAISAYTANSRVDSKLASVAFESGGLYVMASSEQYAAQMAIDAGPQGAGNSGHGHADALNVRVSVDGRKWLVDTGAYSYMSESRDRFRGTSAHNTLRVDGADQASPAGRFAWNSIPSVRVETWIAGESFDLFVGSHDGYARLSDPVLHRRFIFHLHGGFWLVRDMAEGSETHDLDIFWHFAPDLSVTASDSVFVAGYPESPGKLGTCLGLVPVEDAGWVAELSSGYVSPVYGRKERGAVVRCHTRTRFPAEHATLLRPIMCAAAHDHFGRLIRLSPPDNEACTYHYKESGTSHFMIFAKPGKETWTSCEFTSDARFLYGCVKEGQLTRAILCQGKYAEFKGEPVWARGTITNHSRQWVKAESPHKQVIS